MAGSNFFFCPYSTYMYKSAQIHPAQVTLASIYLEDAILRPGEDLNWAWEGEF